MYSSLSRIQNVSGFFSTCAFFIAGVIALSVFLHPGTPSAETALTNVQVVKGRPHYYSNKKEEYAQIKFDLTADLSSLFNWNTKQLFVYVLVTYPSRNRNGALLNSEQNEAIIWDTIITAPESPWSFNNLKTRYYAKTATKSSSPKKPKKRSSSPSKKPKTKTPSKPGVLTLKNEKPKYQITDPSGQLALTTNATLRVGWNVQPWIGALVWDQGLLGGHLGSWQIGKDGLSAAWDFPTLKGAKIDTAKAEADKREAKTLEEGRVKQAVPT